MPIISKITGAPFRFWCQKVLPAVYDDSLSYYELLCKVVDYLNKAMEDDINVINLVNELEEYMNNYFNNLDVQKEINNKLDNMAEDGTLYAIIERFTQPIINDINTDIQDFKASTEETVKDFKTDVTASFNNLENSVTADIDEQDSKIAVLEGRMDTFASLPDGSLSTAADAELVDIRVGAGGEVYKSAGDAVRGQDSYLNSSVNNVTNVVSELTVVDLAWKDNFYINTNVGVGNTVDLTPVESDTFSYIVAKCKAGDVITVRATGGTNPKVLSFLDADNKLLLQPSAASNNFLGGTFTAPENTSKVVCNGVATGSTRIAQIGRDTVREQYSYLNSAVNNVTNAISDLTVVDLTWTDNFYINTNVGVGNTVDLTPVASNLFSYIIAKCKAGDVVTVKATGGSNPKVLSFLDADNKLLLQPSAASNNFLGGTFTAPENTSKVVCNGVMSGGTRIAQIGKSIKDDVLFYYNSNLIALGKTDVGWIGNWIRPECVYFKRLRDKLYFAFTSHAGAKGIAEYDFSTGLITKRVLSKIGDVDLHNDLAIHINTDGTIVAAYSTGHNTDRNVRIRCSVSPECLDYFSEEIVLPCSGVTSYAQLVESSGKLYLFYRSSVLKWAYRVSTDGGVTWSSETILITSDAQYYCLFVKTLTDNVIRVLSYTNPTTSPRDTNIRQSFFHTDNDTLYNSDNTEVLGTENVNKSNITILIANDATLTNQRLLDAAVSPVDTPYVLYAAFSTYNSAVYRLRKGAIVYDIAEAGAPLINEPYFLGACFVGIDKICAICGTRADNGTDFVRLYTIGESSVSLDKVIYSEIRTSLSIRNFYPITDGTKAILWLRGIYGRTYTDFNTDAKIYLIADETIL